jgi:hypothetical protein
MNRASVELDQESVARGFDRFQPTDPVISSYCNRQDAFVIGLFDCLHGLGERM